MYFQNPLLNGCYDEDIHSNRGHFMHIINSPRYRNRRNAIGEIADLPVSMHTQNSVCLQLSNTRTAHTD